MGYRLVTVNPLKPFPIASFGFADVVSLYDAKNQIYTAAKEAAKAEIEALPMETPHERNAEIQAMHTVQAEAQIARLKERWPKIELALEAHLARQMRRKAHFEASCRVAGCNNPRRQKRGSGGERGTKAHRPGVKPLFCGLHAGIRKCFTRETLDALDASSEKRVVIA